MPGQDGTVPRCQLQDSVMIVVLNEFGFGFQCFRVLLQVAALRDHFIQERPFDAGRAGVTRPSDFLSASSE